MPTTILAKTGSILDPSLAEGIAVFIPPGLAFINHNARAFFEQMCGKKAEGAFSFVPVSKPEGKLKFLCLVDNTERQIASVDEMRSQIHKVLDAFARQEVRSVAMNGIRFDDRPDKATRPEQYLRRIVEENLAEYPESFEEIILVDLYGGFEK